jgi:N-acyl-D-aspartate/D-glutamate deacylase
MLGRFSGNPEIGTRSDLPGGPLEAILSPRVPNEGHASKGGTVHDLVIRNAVVCDGTGAEAKPGDVAIADGRIAAITAPGAIAPGPRSAAREIDAGGLVAAPGFIDVHTHYDCQLLWDPTASPSPWHGVTTVVMGNCGFTIAPCLPEHRETVMELLLYVEGMPLDTLRAGIKWSWQEFPEYLAALERQGVGPNVAAFVGMSAVRFRVMGKAAVERAASAEETGRMAAIVREAMAAGAIGWSTSLSPTHFFGDGTPAPTRLSEDDELDAMASVLRELPHGLIELAPKSLLATPDQKMAELEVFGRLARLSGKTVTFAPLHDNPFFPGSAQEILAAASERQRRGEQVVPQVGCRPLEIRFDFEAPCFGLENNPFWKPILHRPRTERRELFASDAFREQLRGFDGNYKALLTPAWERMFLRVPASADTARWMDRSIAEIAAELGKHPVDAFLDLTLADDLAGQWGVEILNADEKGVAELMRSSSTVLALSDAGAHVDTLCDQGFTSYLLGHWVRELGALRLEDAVRMLTSRPAEVYGLRDRGTLAAGLAADVVLFDPKTIRMRPTEVVADLPGGEKRLLQRAEGIPLVLVNGRAVVEDGEPTGALAGRVLRGGVGAR